MIWTKRKSYIFTPVVLLLIAFGGMSSAIAYATTATSSTNGVANGFTISPVLSEITVYKGQSQTVPVTVANPTSAPLTAVPIVNDFVASSNESGTPSLILKNDVPLPVNNFKSLVGSIPTTNLAATQNVTINVTITVPKNAYSGGYYGAIRFEPESIGNTSNVGLTASVGTLFLVTVPGNLTTKLTLVQLSAADIDGNPSSFFTNGQLTTVIRLSDTGNIYTQPFGTVTLKDTWGHILSTTPFNSLEPRSSILPQSIRKFVVKLPNRKYLGHYTLTASIGYGTAGNNLIVATAGFWYIPFWLQLVGIAIVIIIVIVIYMIVHSIQKRRFKRT